MYIVNDDRFGDAGAFESEAAFRAWVAEQYPDSPDVPADVDAGEADLVRHEDGYSVYRRDRTRPVGNGRYEPVVEYWAVAEDGEAWTWIDEEDY